MSLIITHNNGCVQEEVDGDVEVHDCGGEGTTNNPVIGPSELVVYSIIIE